MAIKGLLCAQGGPGDFSDIIPNLHKDPPGRGFISERTRFEMNNDNSQHLQSAFHVPGIVLIVLCKVFSKSHN